MFKFIHFFYHLYTINAVQNKLARSIQFTIKTMKITLIPLLLLSVLGIKSLLEGAYDSPHQVVDTSGNILRVGANYYIIPNPTTKC